jgi:hypothetical protein
MQFSVFWGVFVRVVLRMVEIGILTIELFIFIESGDEVGLKFILFF